MLSSKKFKSSVYHEPEMLGIKRNAYGGMQCRWYKNQNASKGNLSRNLSLACQGTHRNSSMNSWWNFLMLPIHSVPGARKVVRKCRLPSLWPKPEPGTTQTPVASSRRMQ